MTIEEMQLSPSVAKKALELEAAHPGVKFLSGRRTIQAQSAAMAQNLVASHDRHWISKVYVNSRGIREMQQWVDMHPEATTASEIASGLEKIFETLYPAERAAISRHLVGAAFDVEPDSCPLSALEALKPEKLLTHESGLVRWHVQF